MDIGTKDIIIYGFNGKYRYNNIKIPYFYICQIVEK